MTNERECGQCSFQDDCSLAMLLCHDVQSNGNETWIQFVPGFREDEGKYWTSSRFVRVSQLSRRRQRTVCPDI